MLPAFLMGGEGRQHGSGYCRESYGARWREKDGAGFIQDRAAAWDDTQNHEKPSFSEETATRK